MAKEVLLDVYSSFEPTVRALLEMVDASALNVWTLLDMGRIPTWYKGRVALLGDAAHPFLPHQGQGGEQPRTHTSPKFGQTDQPLMRYLTQAALLLRTLPPYAPSYPAIPPLTTSPRASLCTRRSATAGHTKSKV